MPRHTLDVVRWTARVIVLDGRQVIRVRRGPYVVGVYSTVEEMLADPAVPADELEVE